jgi:hypothetical protein
LLHSLPGPASGNDVFYFDDNPGFVYWRGKTVVSGAWRTSPFLEISRLGSRWRIALVQRFCKWHFDMSADEQQDNCYAIHGLDGLISYGNQSRRDYRKGNVFNLENNKPAPFKIPDTDITIDSLLAQRPSGQN